MQSRGLSARSRATGSSPPPRYSSPPPPLQPDMDYDDLVQLIRPTSVSLQRLPPHGRPPASPSLLRARPYSGQPLP
jgi:hypothetical protein